MLREGAPPAVDPVKFDGQLTMGGIKSWLVTVKMHERLLPARSLAMHVTDVGPGGKLNPAPRIESCTPQLIVTTPVSSVAFTMAVTRTLGSPPIAFTVMPDGQAVMTGRTLSMKMA
jgi:hypothetical protein